MTSTQLSRTSAPKWFVVTGLALGVIILFTVAFFPLIGLLSGVASIVLGTCSLVAPRASDPSAPSRTIAIAAIALGGVTVLLFALLALTLVPFAQTP